jgi:hypothetical protein
MRTLSLFLFASILSCHAPAILGGPTEDTTTVLCPDGTRCPLAFPNCPPPGVGGKCEAADGTTQENQ